MIIFPLNFSFSSGYNIGMERLFDDAPVSVLAVESVRFSSSGRAYVWERSHFNPE